MALPPRIPFGNRLRALTLLARGESKEQVVSYLQRRFHPQWKTSKIQLAYFDNPKNPLRLSPHVGKSRLELLGTVKKFSGIHQDRQARAQRVNANPIFRERATQGAIAWSNTPGNIQQGIDALRGYTKSERGRSRAKKFMIRQHRNREFRKTRVDNLHKAWEDPEFVEAARERGRQAMQKLFEDETFLDRHSKRQRAAMIENRANPEYMRRLAEAIEKSEKVRTTRQSNIKIATEAWRQKILDRQTPRPSKMHPGWFALRKKITLSDLRRIATPLIKTEEDQNAITQLQWFFENEMKLGKNQAET